MSGPESGPRNERPGALPCLEDRHKEQLPEGKAPGRVPETPWRFGQNSAAGARLEVAAAGVRSRQATAVCANWGRGPRAGPSPLPGAGW